MSSIRAVLFDLDDTLYSRQLAFHAWARTMVHDRLGVTGAAENAEVVAWLESLDANGYGSKHFVLSELHRRFPNAGGTPDSYYDDFIESVGLSADALITMDALSARAIPFGIVTNGTERQWRKIDVLDLRRRTPCIFVSDTFGAHKPDPSIFLAAAQSLGAEPAQVLFVGDNPVNDIVGAQSAGMQAAWLHRGHAWPSNIGPRPHLIIESLTEVLDLL